MRLRQKLTIGFCAYYLISVIGIALSLHFCGGNLAAVSMSKAKAACELCADESDLAVNDNCCKDTRITVKIHDSHQSVSPVKIPGQHVTDLFLPPVIAGVLQEVQLPHLYQPVQQAPPKSPGSPIYILNCNFRI